jgi:hypothetical protein
MITLFLNSQYVKCCYSMNAQLNVLVIQLSRYNGTVGQYVDVVGNVVGASSRFSVLIRTLAKVGNGVGAVPKPEAGGRVGSPPAEEEAGGKVGSPPVIEEAGGRVGSPPVIEEAGGRVGSPPATIGGELNPGGLVGIPSPDWGGLLGTAGGNDVSFDPVDDADELTEVLFAVLAGVLENDPVDVLVDVELAVLAGVLVDEPAYVGIGVGNPLPEVETGGDVTFDATGGLELEPGSNVVGKYVVGTSELAGASDAAAVGSGGNVKVVGLPVDTSVSLEMVGAPVDDSDVG